MATAMAAVDVVHLKRRVRSADTNLFEWRKCECSVTGDGRLVLELVDEEATADAGHGSEEDDAAERGGGADEERGAGDARVEIDLAWQLQSIEQKKKCKTRCELQYVVLSANAMRHSVKETRSEELMAPSPRHCQQWIELVQEAEKRAKRRQSIRQGTATAAAVAAMSASSSTVSSAASSVKPSARSVAPGARPVDAAFNASASSASAASSSLPPPSSASSTTIGATSRSYALKSSTAQRSSVASASRLDHQDRDDLREDESEPLSPGSGHHATAPLPRELFAQKLTAVRQLLPRQREASQAALESTFDIDDSVEQAEREAQRQQDYEEDDEEEGEERDLHRSHGRARQLGMRRKPGVRSPSSVASSYHGVRVATSASTITRPRRLLSPSSASSTTVSPTSQRRVRPSSATLLHTARRHALPISSSHRGLPSTRHVASAGVNSAAAVAASIQRLRRREGRRDHGNSDDDDGDGALETDGSTREELSILMRVETALRQLERENALAKERELELAHEVQSLQDALRVRSAEKKHLESQLSQMSRDKEQWKQAAQRAEHALAQMQDELVIAQEESQLLSSEKHRLKHHNKELLSQVHRLDSIVYGRF